MSNEMKDWLRDNEEEQKVKWMNEVEAHHELVGNHNAHEREVMFTALYGSQNYGLATEGSDVDTKSFVFPSFWEVALHKPLLSKELTAPDGSHAEMKDYRDMCANLKKQSINFLETLFTPYVVVNPLWESFYQSLHMNRETFARLDVNRGLMSMFGHMCNMEKRFKRDHNMKQAATLLRLEDFMYRYTTDEPYEHVLFNPNQKEFLRNVRAGEVPLDLVEYLVDGAMNSAREFVENAPKFGVNKEGLEWLDTMQVMAMEEYMRRNY